MSDLFNCPFCGESPEKGVVYGMPFAECKTPGCAIKDKCIPVNHWNRRPGRSNSDVALPSTSNNNASPKSCANCGRDFLMPQCGTCGEPCDWEGWVPKSSGE